MELTDKLQICKVITRAIMADVRITDDEREFLYKLMDRYELTEEQRTDVLNRNMDDDPAEMAKEITSLESKDELLTELLTAVAVDGEVAPSEITYVKKVGAAIGVSDADVDMMLEK